MSTNQPVGIPFQNTLSYIGPDMNIIPVKRFPRRPLATDKKYRVGQTAILGSNPSTGVEGELWYLARFEPNGDATWLQLATGASSPGIDFLQTDDGAPPVGPDVNGVVGVLGGTGILTSGQDPSTDVTISVDGSVVGQTITPDSGGPLSPTSGNWNIVGGNGLNTSGSGSTLTINLDGSVVTTQYDGDSGSATPSGGILNIVGGNGTVTSASGNTVVCEMESPFVGDFSFESNTGGTTETFTIQNTVDASSSAANLIISVAGTSADDTWITWNVGSDRTYALGIDTSDSTKLKIATDTTSNTTPSSGTTLLEMLEDVNSMFHFPSLQNTYSLEGSACEILALNLSTTDGDSSSRFVARTDMETADAYILFDIKNTSAPGSTSWKIGSKGTNDGTLEFYSFVDGSVPGLTGTRRLSLRTNGELICDSTKAVTVPRGTTGERPSSPVNGMIRYNTTTSKFEGYEGGAWTNLI